MTKSSSSYIDRSLFGERRNVKLLRNKRRQKLQDEEAKAVAVVDATPPSPAVAASREELRIIQSHSIGPFPTNASKDSLSTSNTNTNNERARERKKYMEALEANAAATRNQRDEDSCQSNKQQAKTRAIRRQAQEKVENEEEDVVKRLQTYSQRAIAFHIRDMQLRDKVVQEQKEKEYERRMELAMEADRLREIERREQEEADKVQRLVEARRVIEDQINERHQQQLLREEAKDQENRDMLEQIKRFQLEEEDRAKERKEQAALARLEVIRLNEEAAEAKRLERLREKEEDDQILAYQAQQDEILRKREEEEREAELQKKELQKKLLENQSRTLDRRAELDELRARRAAEQKEREFRRKELAEAQKRKKDLAMLQEAHWQQEEEKKQERRRLAKMRQEEYEGAMRQAKNMARREEQEAELVRRKNAEFRLAIQQQILDRELQRKAQQREKFNEGRRRQEAMKEDIAKMEAIRDRMVKELQDQGIRREYWAEMMRLDIGDFLSK